MGTTDHALLFVQLLRECVTVKCFWITIDRQRTGFCKEGVALRQSNVCGLLVFHRRVPQYSTVLWHTLCCT